MPAVVVSKCLRMISSHGLRLQFLTSSDWPVPPAIRITLPSHEAEHADGVDHGNGKSPPQAGSDEAQPCEMNIGCSKQRNEQPVAARRFEPQDTDTRRAAWREILPDAHR